MQEYHISQFGPTAVWPNGGWALYQITGEQIAERTIWSRDSGKYEVVERWPWPGYEGIYATLPELFAAIEKLADAEVKRKPG